MKLNDLDKTRRCLFLLETFITKLLSDENSHSYFLRPTYYELSLSGLQDSRNFVDKLLFKDLYL